MNISLDIKGSKDLIYVNQGDTSESITFNIKENGVAVDLTDLTLSFVLHKTSYIVAPLTITSAVNGTATLTLTSAMVNSSGTIVFEVVGMESNDTTAFDISSYMVVQNVYSGDDGQNDPDEENPGIDVLYGEEEPDDEDDGEDKDFYLKLKASEENILSLDNMTSTSTPNNPIDVTDFVASERNQFNFNITGTPNNVSEGENVYWGLEGLVVGNEYTITLNLQFAQGTSFIWGFYDHIIVCGTTINFEADTDLHTYTGTFTYTEDGILGFYFPRVADGVQFTVSITDLTITGDFAGEIEDIYNKHEGYWKKYTPHEMVGATASANGASGIVPKPTISDREKYLRGDGTWQDAQGASAVSDLTDVNLNNLANGEILKYNSTTQKWENTEESGGGGGAGGSSVYSEKILWEDANGYTSDTNAVVTLTDSLLNYDAIVIEVSRESDYNFRNQEFVLASMIDKTGIKWFPFDMIGSSTDCVATCRYVDETHLILGHWTYKKPVKYYKIVGLKFGTLSPIIYSEEEREVGVWIDNKPLYQKTYVLQSEITVTNTWDWTSLGISAGDIETYVSAVAQNNSGTCWAVNCATINGNIAMSTGRNQDTIGVKKFTIQYTKTTDVAGSGSYNTLGVPTVHYSENEQVIGTWIDGKPLYQKTISVNNIIIGNASTTAITSVTDFSNIKQITDAKGYYTESGDEGTFPLVVFRYNSNIYARSIDAFVCNKLTLQYTKTTD